MSWGSRGLWTEKSKKCMYVSKSNNLIIYLTNGNDVSFFMNLNTSRSSKRTKSKMLNSVVFSKRESLEYLLQTFDQLHQSHTLAVERNDTTAVVPCVIDLSGVSI
jgi:hypothetical protein